MNDRHLIDNALGESALTTQSAGAFDYRPVAMMPDTRVIKVGGQSIMDRGARALFPSSTSWWP